MNAQQLELFRKAVLQVFDANRTRFGLSLPAVRFNVAIFGFRAAVDGELLDVINYLAGKGLLEEVRKTVSAEVRAWRITEAGIALVDSGA